MANHALKMLAVLLCAGTSARAGALFGYVDGSTGATAYGWACVKGAEASVSVAAYAGPLLIGVYPMTQDRPDVAPICQGAQPHGFAIAFDPSAQALFAGQTQLSLYATAPGLPPLLLPASTARTYNPLPLPSGKLVGMTSDGQVAAAASSVGGAPEISLFAGGPANDSAGMVSAIAQPLFGGSYGVQLPMKGLASLVPPRALMPVFGTVTSRLGVTAPLGTPLPVPVVAGSPTGGTILPLDITFAQTGAYTAIRNNVFTRWVPRQAGFAGLTGTVSLSGNSAGFDEQMVEIGTVPAGQAACAAQNGQSIPGAPPIARLWASILKSNSAGSVSIPVNFALPYPVPGAAAGTCLMTWISAGYAYLADGPPQYATTRVSLQAYLVPLTAAAPMVVPFGMGGEFRFTGGGAPTSVYVGIRAETPLAVDGIAGTASAAAIEDAPATSGWLPAPQGNWGVQTVFQYVPAKFCAAANLVAQPGNGIFAVLRDATPAVMPMPQGAVTVMSMPISSVGGQAVQRSAYAAFPPGPAHPGFAGTLAVGDCLVAYSTASLAPASLLDAENQSTVFLRPIP